MPNWVHDPALRTRVSYPQPANGLNQLKTINGGNVAYDARGNLTSDPSSGATYVYDSDNS